jgi:Ca2+-transporting ATPase
VPRDDRLIDRALLDRVVLMASSAVAVCLSWFAWRHSQGVPDAVLRSETFSVLDMRRWFNVLNCQSASASAIGLRIVRNRWLLGGLTLSVLLQALVLYAPPMNALFHTVPLPVLGLGLGLANVVQWAEVARKLWVRSARRNRA